MALKNKYTKYVAGDKLKVAPNIIRLYNVLSQELINVTHKYLIFLHANDALYLNYDDLKWAYPKTNKINVARFLPDYIVVQNSNDSIIQELNPQTIELLAHYLTAFKMHRFSNGKRTTLLPPIMSLISILKNIEWELSKYNNSSNTISNSDKVSFIQKLLINEFAYEEHFPDKSVINDMHKSVSNALKLFYTQLGMLTSLQSSSITGTYGHTFLRLALSSLIGKEFVIDKVAPTKTANLKAGVFSAILQNKDKFDYKINPDYFMDLGVEKDVLFMHCETLHYSLGHNPDALSNIKKIETDQEKEQFKDIVLNSAFENICKTFNKSSIDVKILGLPDKTLIKEVPEHYLVDAAFVASDDLVEISFDF